MKLAEKILKNEAVDVESVMQAVVDAKPSDDNAEQGKFVQLLRGLAFSDDPKATAFMAKVMKAIDKSFMGKMGEGLKKGEWTLEKEDIRQVGEAFEEFVDGGFIEHLNDTGIEIDVEEFGDDIASSADDAIKLFNKSLDKALKGSIGTKTGLK